MSLALTNLGTAVLEVGAAANEKILEVSASKATMLRVKTVTRA